MIKRLMKRNIKKVLTIIFGISFVLPIVSTACFAAENDDERNHIIVSLGDSYSSGEGLEPFYGQNDDVSIKVNNPDWLAHRSQKAWPGMLTLPSVKGKMAKPENKDKHWYFVAASGATTENMQYTFRKDYKKGKYEGSYYLEPQLAIFDQIGKNEADYVTLTLGGNDAGFTDIIQTCVLGSTSVPFLNPNGLSDKLNNTWVYFFTKGGIRDKLYDTYKNIADKAGSQAQIIVAGYPRLLNPNGGATISSKEASMVNENVTNFNRAIESIVQNCQSSGIKICFVSVEESFGDHGAYSLFPYINNVMLTAEPEDLKDFMPASAYSMHPNRKGVRKYAECVQAKINELEHVESTEKYNSECTVSVFDENENLYDNYNIKIDGTEFTGLFKTGLFKKDYSKTITVDKAEIVNISLPKGNYKISVIDCADGENSYTKEVLIRPHNDNTSLIFKTDFGADSTQINEKLSDERNIVLTLDVSGSMAGTPLEETKKASTNFISTVLEEDASIGIVTYDDISKVISGFSNDKSSLQNIISDLYDGGGTDIAVGLRDAQWMLSKTSSKKEIIVLMSDGEPNVGLEGEDLIAYADEIKKSGTLIYTIGFFEDLADRSYAQYLMEHIASDGCHYEVANADELVFFFEDMADQINGQKYIYVRIACPVDVSVTYNGETLDSAETNLNLRTDFGTLTFEDNTEEISGNLDDRIKVLRLKEGPDYDLKLEGTGHGIMNYTIGFMDDDGNYSDLRKFEDIRITKRTQIDTVATVSSNSTLNIDEDGDGKYDLKLRAVENGYGEEIKNPDWIRYAIAAACILIFSDIVIIIVIRMRKNKKGKADNN